MAKRIQKPVLLTSKTHQVIDKDFIVKALTKSNAWLFRAIVSIFEYQTADEQTAEVTAHDNGVGFSGVDAQMMSSFAKQIIEHGKGNSKFASPLSPKQIELARKRMVKYAGQLLRIAQSRSAAVQL
jgi:hypothetical protein